MLRSPSFFFEGKESEKPSMIFQVSPPSSAGCKKEGGSEFLVATGKRRGSKKKAFSRDAAETRCSY